jgi:hypothetical protein
MECRNANTKSCSGCPPASNEALISATECFREGYRKYHLPCYIPNFDASRNNIVADPDRIAHELAGILDRFATRSLQIGKLGPFQVLEHACLRPNVEVKALHENLRSRRRCKPFIVPLQRGEINASL